MSRRKQSNPKPLLKSDCESTAGEMETLRDQDADNPVDKQSQVTDITNEMIKSRSPSSVGETSPSFSNCSSPISPSTNDHSDQPQMEHNSPTNNVEIKQEIVLPKLRLNVMLASDPALQPEAKDLKVIRINESAVENKNNHNNDRDPDDARQLNEIHQHGQVVDNKVESYMAPINEPIINVDVIPRVPGFKCGPCGIKFSSISTLEAHQTYYCTHRKDADESNASKPSTNDDGNGTESTCKSIRIGKQYACSQCSYSADKKVSLNRHMRMHQTSPTPSSVTSNGDDCPSQIQQIDRYCTDCDIRFSSTKTYRAHKQHYCSSRHRDGTAASTPAPKSNASKSGSQSPPELAKSPPVMSPPYLALPTNPIVIIPYSLIRGASVLPGPLTSTSPATSNPDLTCYILKNGSLSPIAQALAVQSAVSPVPQRSQTPNNIASNIISVDAGANTIPIELMKVKKKETMSMARDLTIPLDLSVRRLSSEILPHRERSVSFSSCLSGDHGRLSIDMMMEGKENLSIESNSVTPEQIVCAPSLPGSPPLTPSPKRSSHSPRGILAASPNSIHSSNHTQSAMLRQLIPSDLAARLSESSLNLHTPKPLFDRQSAELTLRISTTSNASTNHPENAQNKSTGANKKASASNSLAIGQPQIFVKQGVSKCKECNIVFCKYENYLAHKKHYCSARNLEDKEGSKPSPPPSPSANASGGTAPLAYQQLICAACGIKFTSLDNLSAHQMYYCPKRIEIPLQTPQKEKCPKCKSMHEPNGQCPNQNVYKCPICDVVSVNAAESRRHIETHAGVKAFRCSICRYKGNTLRGMRTHIRMHFDKKSTDFNEEHYISCILEEDVLEIPPVAQMAPTESVQPQLHCCDKCNYSSSYKGNVVRHIKLVHTQTQIHSTSPKLGEGGESLLHSDNSTKPTSVSLVIKTEPGEPIDTNRSSSDIEVINEPPLKRIKLEAKDTDDKTVTETIESDCKAADRSTIVASTEPKYCNICDITFNYLNTFIAHKKFYCKNVTADIETNSSAISQPQPAATVLTRTAETSVL
ncbi:hypothetical protein HA402_009289 [Bradysia odoriphaga]|nr:hypothetical protein HA402_009289 [Bradysia odoriphaga]